jgi:hypothetical protein
MDETFYTALVEVEGKPALVSSYYASSTQKTRDLAERKVEQCRQRGIPLLLLFDDLTSTECMVAITLWTMKIRRGPLFMLCGPSPIREEYYGD